MGERRQGCCGVPASQEWRRWVLSLESKDQLYETHLEIAEPERPQQRGRECRKISFWSRGVILAGEKETPHQCCSTLTLL